jgi:hypothetical protein
MKYDLSKVKSTVENLHVEITNSISASDNLQDFLLNHPQRDDLTTEYEYYNHIVKEKLSSIRKLESFIKVYEPGYISKPEYPGEERDKVNTY